MKYCSKCGYECTDEAVVCLQCGCALPQKQEEITKTNTLQTIAKAFMILGTVLLGLYIIPLAWCLPMTISYCNKIKRKEPVSTAFKICSLLFVSTVGGILMLCDKE